MAEMTADEILRKRAEEFGSKHKNSGVIDVMCAFAAEQSALAREAAIAECAQICRKTIVVPTPYNTSSPSTNMYLHYGNEQCAEAIERLAERKD